MTFAERLKNLRMNAGMTQEALSASSGVPVTTLRGYEQGKRIPGLGPVVRMAESLGTDCRAFADCEDLGGVEEQIAPKPKARRKGKPKARK